MSPAKRKSRAAGARRSRRPRARADKFETITGGELHGRGGEALPTHERAIVGQDDDWEHESAAEQPRARTARGARSQKRSIEIEYERGPGSRFQREGRGEPRSKRVRGR
jgi:hypothetical protein